MKIHYIFSLAFQFCYYLPAYAEGSGRRKRNIHPPEFTSLIQSKLEESLRNPIHSTNSQIARLNKRHRRASESSKTQDIRIHYITTPLEQAIAQSKDSKTKVRGDTIINEILPQIASNLAKTFKVVPTSSLSVPTDACFGYFKDFINPQMSKPGIKDRDLVIFISAFETVGDQQLCNSNPNLSTLAVSSPCNIDSNDRPVIGFANICLNTLKVSNNNSVDQTSLLELEDVLTHEVVHILGLNSSLFKYFRSAFDNKPLTPRIKNLFGRDTKTFEEKEFRCVNEKENQKLGEINSENTLVYKTEKIKKLDGTEERGYYEIILPTVAQVVRNQFNCQSLQGARLENQPTSQADCIGSHFDERYFFTDIMSALYDDDAAYFSPLLLALLEDSGWYLSNFRRAENSPFGINMGCDFVEKDCIVEGLVPSYGKGYFCNNFDTKIVKCGPSHHYRGTCDLVAITDVGRDYFGRKIGPQFTHADWCPLVQSEVTDCDNEGATKIDPIEVFHPKSRCMDVNMEDNTRTALCIRSFCDDQSKSFIFNIGGQEYKCGSGDGHRSKKVIHNGKLYKFICPNLPQACPDFFCPAMCSGKGVCEWRSDGSGVCKCFDPNDKSPGCYFSPVNIPPNSAPMISLLLNVILILFIILSMIIF